ncbi:MAG: acetate--CoA ligase family protein, partial [Spirochaetales bacterium]|nr:acetate--CoA ligase family protein [Spirochaetales bacterium]
MKIHEYQAKEMLASYGVAVPKGIAVKTPEQAYEIAKRFGSCVVKAQVHSGGRGNAGGVKFAKTPEDAKSIATQMLGMKLVTKQTGPEGKIVRQVLIAQPVDVKREFYLSITGDSERA